MSTNRWLNVDALILKLYADNNHNRALNSFVGDIYDGLSLNDSNEWHKHPGLPFAFNIEATLDGFKHVRWFKQYWHYSIYVSIMYMIMIFYGERWMRSRKPYNIRGLLSLWSGSLAIFSIIGAIRCLPEFIHILWNKGFIESFCSNSYIDDNRLVFWYLVFIWSKIFELGDTAFIVLRKQKLINLHWVHHVLTLCYCFFVFKEQPGTARWMVGMNFAIHSAMYSYYCLRALQFRIPRVISVTITCAQIIQMIFGLIINIISFAYKMMGTHKCDMTLSAATTGLALYLLFFALFLNFFVHSYLKRPQTRRQLVDNNNGDSCETKKLQ